MVICKILGVGQKDAIENKGYCVLDRKKTGRGSYQCKKEFIIQESSENELPQGREHYYRLGVRKSGKLWTSVGKYTIAVCQPTQTNSMFSVFG